MNVNDQLAQRTNVGFGCNRLAEGLNKLTRTYFLLTMEGGDERGLPGEVRGRGGAPLCQDQVESSALESCQEPVITIITNLLDALKCL